MASGPPVGPPPRSQRVARRLARHIPDQLLVEPERYVVNMTAAVLGMVAALGPPKGGIIDIWPDWGQYAWAVLMVTGGTAALHGAWTGFRPSERLGAACVGLGVLIYAVCLAVEYGWAATSTALIFGCLALAKVLRIIRSLDDSATARVIAQISHPPEDGDG